MATYVEAATEAAEKLRQKAAEFRSECDHCPKCRVYREHGISSRCPRHDTKWLQIFGAPEEGR